MTRGEVTRTARQRAGRKQDRHNGAGSESFSSLIEVGSYLSIGGGKKARVAKRQGSGPGDLSRRLEHFLRLSGNRRSVGPKSKCTTLVHFATQPFRSVILSAAKNLTARPFAALRVTDLLCQSFVV